jgi:Icc protein
VEKKSLRVWKKGPDSAEEIFRREMTNPTNGPEVADAPNQPTYCENVYSFDYGNSHFVMLNNDYKSLGGILGELEKGKIVGLQLDWLRGDLDSAAKRGQQNIFVFFHEPAFPSGGHLGNSMYHNGNKAYVEPRDEFWRLLCRHKVVAVFCGHEHNYSRTLVDEKVDKSFSSPIWQIVTGGGGAPFHTQDRPPWAESVKAFSSRENYCILSVAGKKVEIRVFDTAGSLIDSALLK